MYGFSPCQAFATVKLSTGIQLGTSTKYLLTTQQRKTFFLEKKESNCLALEADHVFLSAPQMCHKFTTTLVRFVPGTLARWLGATLQVLAAPKRWPATTLSRNHQYNAVFQAALGFPGTKPRNMPLYIQWPEVPLSGFDFQASHRVATRFSVKNRF